MMFSVHACIYLHVDPIRATVGRPLHHFDSIRDWRAKRHTVISEIPRCGVQTSQVTSTLGKTHRLRNPVK